MMAAMQPFSLKPRPMRPLRIRTYLLLLVLAGAAPFIVLSGILVQRTAASQIDGFGRDVVAVARALSLAVDGRVAPLLAALDTLARDPTLGSGDVAAFRPELVDAARLLGNILLLSDADGRELLNSSLPDGAPLPRRATSDHISRIVAGGVAAVSGAHRSSDGSRLVATVDVPVRIAGGLDGSPRSLVLSAVIELSSIDDIVRRQRLPAGWLGGVIDRDGRLLQRTLDNAASLGQRAGADWIRQLGPTEGWIHNRKIEGAWNHTGFVTSAVTGWTVGVGVPDEIVRAPLRGVLLSLLALGTGLTAISVGLAIMLARRIARPVAALARLGAETPEATPRGIREVDEVAAALSASIATRRAAEAALRESEAELRAATELSPLRPWTADPEGRLLSVSDRVGNATGRPPEERLGDGWANVVHPADRPAMVAAWAQSVATGQPFDHEFRLKMADGSWRWCRSRATPRRADGGTILRWYGATEDVHDRREAEAGLRRLTETLEARVAEEVAAREMARAQLAQAQRMQALGQLASGIAHDFNNVLQAVSGGMALILRRPEDTPRVARLAAMAAEAVARGAAVTGRLLSFARRGELSPGAIDAERLLRNMAEVLTPTLGAGISVEVATEAGMPALLADQGQLETVLINVAINARDAMPLGGVLRLSAALDRVGPEVSAALAPGDYIRIEAADTGQGMDEVTLSRASEPFFTTKPVGQGTGLGLAMARGFAEQSGGALQIESSPGLGTVVRLWLPATMAQIAAAPPPPVEPMPGRARVLLVDDDAAVRATVAEQLEEHGYTVVSAPDALAGLALLAEDADVALLVSDLTMPGMDGVTLIQAAQRHRPGLPAILMTGYAGGGAALAMRHAVEGPFSLLQKPVTATQLADRIAALLEDRVGA